MTPILLLSSSPDQSDTLLSGRQQVAMPSQMTIDHLGEPLVGLEPLPFHARPPVLEQMPQGCAPTPAMRGPRFIATNILLVSISRNEVER